MGDGKHSAALVSAVAVVVGATISFVPASAAPAAALLELAALPEHAAPAVFATPAVVVVAAVSGFPVDAVVRLLSAVVSVAVVDAVNLVVVSVVLAPRLDLRWMSVAEQWVRDLLLLS